MLNLESFEKFRTPVFDHQRPFRRKMSAMVGILSPIWYYKRAPCAFRASVARGLYVLAGFADADRPRRPRSSWVFGRGGFVKSASLPPSTVSENRDIFVSTLGALVPVSCFFFDELAASTTAWLKANKPEVLDSKVEKAFCERGWLIVWTLLPQVPAHRARVGSGQAARVRHVLPQPRPSMYFPR